MRNATRNEEIIRRRKAGEFPSDIYRDMKSRFPTITRNTVIGVCFRAGVVDKSRNDQRASSLKHAPKGKRPWLRKPKAICSPEVRKIILACASQYGVASAAGSWGVSKNAIYNWRRAS